MLTLAQTPEHPAAAGPREEQVFPPRFFFCFSFSLFTPAVTPLFRRENCRDVDNSSSTGRVVSESEMTRVYQKGNPRNIEEDSCHLRFSFSQFP